MPITGVHTMFYSSDAPATRAFLRDVLKFPYTDVGEGWLIFETPPADMGVHPSHDAPHAKPGAHDISFFCTDIEDTIADLKSKGVQFLEPVTDQGFGLVTHFKIPGGITVQLYQPAYRKNPQSA